MSVHVLKQKWTRKPSNHPKINWSNPITRGLKHAYLMNIPGSTLKDLVNNLDANVSGTDSRWQVGKDGWHTDYASGTNVFETGAPDNLNGLTQATVIFSAAADAWIGSDCALSIRSGTGTSDLLVFYPFDTAGGNGIRVYWSGSTVFNDNSGTYADSDFHNFALVRRASDDQELYVDAVSVGQDSTNRSWPSSLTNITFGAWYEGQQSYTEKLNFALFFDRALSEAELLSLQNNPYQIIQPRTLYIPYSTAAVSIALTGTATASITESDIFSGGKTIILTITGDTFVAAGTGPIGSTADTQALIDAFSAATSPTNGWNNEVRDKALTSEIVRTSDTVATWTIAAQSGYDIASQETIGPPTIPAAVLTGGSPVVADSSFTIDPVSAGTILPLLNAYHG